MIHHSGVEKTSALGEKEVFLLETTITAASTVNKHFSKALLWWFVSFFDYFVGYPRLSLHPIQRISESLVYKI